MNKYIVPDPWLIIENEYNKDFHQITESLLSLGNGRMGQRANHEETYTGPSLLGNYIAGVYYPDKTRVGWWKNGYPEYFAKVLNSVNWVQLKVIIDDEEIDLAKAKLKNYRRTLDMQRGILDRSVVIHTKNNKTVSISSERFYSLIDQDTCFLKYSIQCDQSVNVRIESYLDFNIRNSDSNYDEDFWTNRTELQGELVSNVNADTQKTNFRVSAAVQHFCAIDETPLGQSSQELSKGKTSDIFESRLDAEDIFSLTKCVAITSSFYYQYEEVQQMATDKVLNIRAQDYIRLKDQHSDKWKKRWSNCDVKIEGDVSAQQAIRFNIYQLYQTYSGEDARLNIGPKGFTGEKYGGSTYWDTEAYCLPFYMATGNEDIARNLLLYRHNHLEKAIENAEKLGFEDGAALYPMVTINGEECHNEWEITFEEIHRNGAIAYAIFNFIRYTGNKEYLASHGLDVLIGISRFWSQRVHLSPQKNEYVMLGVTGPNEYENNIDNNWYTNYIAKWCLQYTLSCISKIKNEKPDRWKEISNDLNVQEHELETWSEMMNKMYLPYDQEKGVILQHDGYLDKEDLTTCDLKKEDRPINQNWSWDRILRSPFIKQADVLQGLYFFKEHFTQEEIRANFEYYEPKTVHESSLSPCVHGILAAHLGMKEKAYEMYLRTARLDLDNYNNDTEDGCHITSMAGTWMTIVEGFAGMSIQEGILHFSPFLPEKWTSFSFKVNFRESLLELKILKDTVTISNSSSTELSISVNQIHYKLTANSHIECPLKF